MGIDCQLIWDNRNHEEEQKKFDKAIQKYIEYRKIAPAYDAPLIDPVNQIFYQINGFSQVLGHLGYLRESYHGEPYATKYLFREAWSTYPTYTSCRITGEELKQRLPKTKQLAEIRARRSNYDPRHVPQILKSFDDFVNLFLEKEKAGLHPYVEVSY